MVPIPWKLDTNFSLIVLSGIVALMVAGAGGGGLNSIRQNLTSFYCTLTSGILLYYTVNIFKEPFMFTHLVQRNSGLSESEEGLEVVAKNVFQ